MEGGGGVSSSRRSLEDKCEHAVLLAPLGGAVCNIKEPLTAERRGGATGDERFKRRSEFDHQPAEMERGREERFL